jgi:hypothetical protein
MCRLYVRSTPSDISVATTVVPAVARVGRVTGLVEGLADVRAAGLALVEGLEARAGGSDTCV